MRRRISLLAAVLLCLSAVLAACGTKDAESVVKELDKVVSSMQSYQGKGKMTLHTGQQPLEYQVEVTFQQPSYYRIKLTNAKKDITQIVLRNDEGVFVLTPRLNKVFRFQSDWPANQGQVYLYQTLVQSIMVDNSRQFTVDKDAYVFDVMANYQNASLSRQKIWLSKSDYSPQKVQVSDANETVMVEVNFDQFDFDSKLDKSVFDTQRNLSGDGANKPTTADPADSASSAAEDNSATPESGDAAASEESAGAPDNSAGAPNDSANDEADNSVGDNADNSVDGTTDDQTAAPDEPAEDTMAPADKDSQTEAAFTAMEPSYSPEGVAFKDVQDIQFGGNPGIMLRYAGAYDYTLIETQPHDVAASSMKGTLVDLGFTIGSLSGDEEGMLRTLTWTYNGTEFRLTTGTLPEAEMLKVAQSVQGEMSK